MIFRNRLGRERIQASTRQGALFERVGKSHLVDDLAASCVDQNRIVFHRCQERGIDKVFGFGRHGHVDAHNIAGFRKLIERQVRHAQLVFNGFIAPAVVPVVEFAAKRTQACSCLDGNRAKTHQPDFAISKFANALEHQAFFHLDLIALANRPIADR